MSTGTKHQTGQLRKTAEKHCRCRSAGRGKAEVSSDIPTAKLRKGTPFLLKALVLPRGVFLREHFSHNLQTSLCIFLSKNYQFNFFLFFHVRLRPLIGVSDPCFHKVLTRQSPRPRAQAPLTEEGGVS